VGGCEEGEGGWDGGKEGGRGGEREGGGGEPAGVTLGRNSEKFSIRDLIWDLIY
jgi:hypothetical protein